MNTIRRNVEPGNQNKALQRYYQFHSKIYDVTRWSFLFGRNAIIDQASMQVSPKHVLEVGCGTGRNLITLAKTFPDSQLMGVDVSQAMLKKAGQKLSAYSERIELKHQPYPLKKTKSIKYDLILFSYVLSMFNPGWKSAIKAAHSDLAENGTIAIVDFHHCRYSSFRRWMGKNHVAMDAHLLPFLMNQFQEPKYKINHAYAGLWEYFLFTGKKN